MVRTDNLVFQYPVRSVVQKPWRGDNLGRMSPDEKRRLARTGDTGVVACAIRLRAARKAAGLGSTELARAAGVSPSSYSNAENAGNFPAREVMRYLNDEHRVDYNFLLGGMYSQLPGDIQELLFPALDAATSEWDRKEGASRSRAPGRPRPANS